MKSVGSRPPSNFVLVFIACSLFYCTYFYCFNSKTKAFQVMESLKYILVLKICQKVGANITQEDFRARAFRATFLEWFPLSLRK